MIYFYQRNIIARKRLRADITVSAVPCASPENDLGDGFLMPEPEVLDKPATKR
jgi:hypothetical protein